MTVPRNPKDDRFAAPPDPDDPLQLGRSLDRAGTMVDDLPLPRANRLRKYKKPATYSVGMLIFAAVGFWVMGKRGIQEVRDAIPEFRKVEQSLQQPKLPTYAAAGPGENFVLVQFELDPPTTRLFIDGRILESNPFRFARGQRIIRMTAFEPGYEPATVEVLPSENRTVPVKLRRTRAVSPGKPTRGAR